MFRDMGVLPADRAEALVHATAAYLAHAMPAGEYLGWIAEAPGSEAETVGGGGAQLRSILPRPDGANDKLELGPEAIILNVYVERDWRRRGVAEGLMRALLTELSERGVYRVVLHASPDGKRLYERLGFEQTNEMRLMR
jgi:ribosomal protein S18 acetylase RimI-like enzyme